MSNYLRNVIAKSFNHAEVARPRLTSMFEPLAPSAPPAFGEIHPMETLDFERPPEDARSANMMQEDRQDTESKKTLPLPTMNESSKEIETPVWRGNQQPVRLEHKTAEPQILHRQSTLQNQIDVQPSARQAIEKGQQENDSPTLPLSNLKKFKTQTSQQRNAESSSQEASPSAPALMQGEEKTVSRQSLQALSKITMQNESAQIRRPINEPTAKPETKASDIAYLTGALAATKVTVQPRIALPVENQRASGKMSPSHQQSLAQQAEKGATPTINVTIGRIEVRATTAAAPPRKQTPVAQTMSLDEYLRQRNRGGRE